jgi:hypothetical protein
MGSSLFMIGFPVLIVGGAYYLTRTFYAAHVRKERGRLQGLLDQLSIHASSVIDERSVDPVIESGAEPRSLPHDTG